MSRRPRRWRRLRRPRPRACAPRSRRRLAGASSGERVAGSSCSRAKHRTASATWETAETWIALAVGEGTRTAFGPPATPERRRRHDAETRNAVLLERDQGRPDGDAAGVVACAVDRIEIQRRRPPPLDPELLAEHAVAGTLASRAVRGSPPRRPGRPPSPASDPASSRRSGRVRESGRRRERRPRLRVRARASGRGSCEPRDYVFFATLCFGLVAAAFVFGDATCLNFGFATVIPTGADQVICGLLQLRLVEAADAVEPITWREIEHRRGRVGRLRSLRAPRDSASVTTAPRTRSRR